MMIPRSRSWPVLWALAALLYCGLPPLGVAVAEEDSAKTKPAADNENRRFGLAYALKHIEPSMAVDVLSVQLESKGVRVVVDDRTNRVILVGPDEAHRRATTLLKFLDVPAENDNVNAAAGGSVRVVSDNESSDGRRNRLGRHCRCRQICRWFATIPPVRSRSRCRPNTN